MDNLKKDTVNQVEKQTFYIPLKKYCFSRNEENRNLLFSNLPDLADSCNERGFSTVSGMGGGGDPCWQLTASWGWVEVG